MSSSKQDEVVVLDFWVSPFCMRVKIALEEKGVVGYELKEENLLSGKSDLLLKSNPIYQKVPVLLHNGKPIIESTNIVYYIDEAWPSSTSLLPSCAYGRARARFWADFVEKKVFDAGAAIWGGKGGEIEAAKNEFIDVIKKLEGALGEKDYFGGDTFGFVDVIAIPLTSWFLTYERFGGFKVEEECPRFAGWMKRCQDRESVAKALPDPEKVYEFVIRLRKMRGIE